MGPTAHQPRGQMAKLRQFDLEFALEAAGSLREDVQNETRAIHDPTSQESFQIALLRRRQGVIENHQFRPALAHSLSDLVGFSAANEQPRIGSVPPPRDQRYALGARRHRQLSKLGEPLLVFKPI